MLWSTNLVSEHLGKLFCTLTLMVFSALESYWSRYMKSFPSSVQEAGKTEPQLSAHGFSLFAFSTLSSIFGIFSKYISLLRLKTPFYKLPFTLTPALC